jgi:hypothetical protein
VLEELMKVLVDDVLALRKLITCNSKAFGMVRLWMGSAQQRSTAYLDAMLRYYASSVIEILGLPRPSPDIPPQSQPIEEAVDRNQRHGHGLGTRWRGLGYALCATFLEEQRVSRGTTRF